MEAWSEQSTALAAGSDIAGTAAIPGGIPLVLALVSLTGPGVARLVFEGTIVRCGADCSEWVP